MQNIQRKLILSTIVLCLTSPVSAIETRVTGLEEQELSIRERALAPKIRKYPVLDELENTLYPLKNFSKDNPSKRLERIELAVFGEIQTGSISERLSRLKSELESWAIANYPQNDKPLIHPVVQPPVLRNSLNQNYRPMTKKSIDYDYMNYRLISPLIRNVGNRGIHALFNK